MAVFSLPVIIKQLRQTSFIFRSCKHRQCTALLQCQKKRLAASRQILSQCKCKRCLAASAYRRINADYPALLASSYHPYRLFLHLIAGHNLSQDTVCGLIFVNCFRLLSRKPCFSETNKLLRPYSFQSFLLHLITNQKHLYSLLFRKCPKTGQTGKCHSMKRRLLLIYKFCKTICIKWICIIHCHNPFHKTHPPNLTTAEPSRYKYPPADRHAARGILCLASSPVKSS